MKLSGLFTKLLALIFCIFSHFSNAQYYVVTELGSLGGDAIPRAINNLGEVAGTSQTVQGDWFTAHAFLYSGGEIVDLYPYGIGNEAIDINDRSQVIGTGENIYSKGDVTYVGGYLKSINNYGVVLGSNSFADNYFIYSFGSKTTFPLPEGSVVSGINDSLDIVGYTLILPSGGWNRNSFIYDYPLGGVYKIDQQLSRKYIGTQPKKINNRGSVVGYIAIDNSVEENNGLSFPYTHPYIYLDNKMIDLGDLVSSPVSGEAYDINNNDEVVGEVSSGFAGFLYKNGKIKWLKDYILPEKMYLSPTAINDKGQIAAVSYQSGKQVAVLLDPVNTFANVSGVFKLKGCSIFSQATPFALKGMGENFILRINSQDFSSSYKFAKNKMIIGLDNASLVRLAGSLSTRSGCSLNILGYKASLSINKKQTSAKLDISFSLASQVVVRGKTKNIKGTYKLKGVLPWSSEIPAR